MSNVLALLLCIAVIFINVIANQVQFETIYEWKYVDFEWKDKGHKKAAIASGDYNYMKPVMVDTDYSRDGRTFITLIKTDGVPSSLNVVGQRRGSGGPFLQPYPNWKWTKRGNCNGITSVYKITIDHCNRLWALDNGKIGQKAICPAQLLVFDLATDKLIKRVKIPDNLARNSETKVGRLVTPIVETHGPRCTNTTVYMADTVGYGLVIYNRGKIWRLESEVFRSDPTVTNHTLPSESFGLHNGILGMAKHPDIPVLYFRPMSSHNIHSVRTRDLKKSRYGLKVSYRTIRDVIPSQVAAMDISLDGILFFGLLTELSLACWNTCKPLDKGNLGIIVCSHDRFQFISSVKIIPEYRTNADEEIWIVTDRMQKAMLSNRDFTKINFRVMKINVAQLTTGTVCAKSWQ